MSILSGAPETRTGDLRREFQVRSWNKDSGLPDDKVFSLRQTRDGYLWIGTSHGLVRFDGVAFTRFTRGTHPVMADDHCTALAEDADGHLWVAIAAGLLRWDGDKFLFLGTGQGLASDVPSALLATRAGDLWIGMGNHLQRIPRGTTTPGPELALGGSVLCLAEDQHGMIWAGGDGDRLSRLEPTTGAMQPIASPPDVQGAIFDIRSRAKSGLCVLFSDWPARSNRFLTFADGRWEGPSPWPSFNGGRAEFLASDHTGALWSPDSTNGLVRWRGGQLERFAAPWTAPEDCALCVLEDREQNLWIGTESSGLFCLTPRRLTTVARADGLAHDQVRALWPAAHGGIWAATDGGLSWIGPHLHAVTNWTEAGGDTLAKLTAVAETADGTVWLGGGHGQFFGRDGRLQPHRFHRPAADLSWDDNDKGFNKVRCFLPARDGSLWVAVPRGLHRLQGGQDRWFTTADGLGADDVRALLETRDGTLWAGTAGGGLSRSTGGTDRAFTTLTRRDGLSRDTVWALLEDRDGVLWAGTDGGLDRIEQGRITRFDRRQGLPDGGVNSLLEDDDGHLWVGHDHGIYRVGRAELTAVAAGRAGTVLCVPFGVADGMAVAECNGQTATPAAAKTADGRLWFATPKGVVVVDPHAVLTNDVPPLAAIEEVRADEETVFASAAREDDARMPAPGAGRGTRSAGHGDRRLVAPRLAPGRGRVVEFGFTALNFAAPERSVFSYRLDGGDPPGQWHEAGPRRVAYYTGLVPGDYRFHVRAANHHGIWSEMPATFAFSLAPFVWQTWWFKAGALSSACGLALLVVRWRIRESRHLADLTARISERSRLARDMHDHLGAHVAELAQLGGLLERLPPAGAAPFRQRLAELTGDISGSLRDMVWATTPLSDDLPHLLDHLAGAAGRQLRSAGIALVVDFPPRIPAWPVTGPRRHDLLLAVQEAVTNAAKHSGATEVVLRLRLEADAFVLEVADNGRGLSAGTVSSGPLVGAAGGCGLPNLRHRAAQLGGSVEFVDVPGSGLTVRFFVPKQPPTMKSR